MIRGLIVLFLLVIVIIIIYLIPAWIPVKYAKMEADFYKYENAILIKRTFYATGASWKIVGDSNSFYDKENICDIWLEKDDKPIIEMPLSEYDNTYLCIVKKIEGGKYWEEGGEYFEAYKLIDWYPIYPIKREKIILPECMYPSGFLNKYDFE
ncbi:hypothetical protein [Lachnoanaerobaculum umeaense]|uniref:hypothetical protein n=1 Tax=Lachnoanaerobaculum umeaense TaxID=617123 RepID=UPI001FA8DCC5|nr:hypothetical protein [Lachnoanaerobaculum umeaense]